MLFKKKDAAPKHFCAGPHLTKPSEIPVGAIPYFPTGTNSLLSDCMDVDTWKSLEDKKDSFGYTFKDAIFSGLKNTDSSVGIYAGSADSYETFAPLLDKIICKYHHGFSIEAGHTADMDASKLKCPKIEDDRIISTRVRVARNFDKMPLGTKISSQDRSHIESAMISAFDKMDGDLSGKYYALSTMTAEEQESLINDHFLFKKGDRFLEACGLNRDWPNNRGIFHNDAKTFLVWVNEEDQLRIISMENGGDIGSVFERLSRGISSIERVCNDAEMSFSLSKKFGYITSCPSNLGTGLRASVHVKLPKLGEFNRELMDKIAKEHYVQVRGIHGEHTAAELVKEEDKWTFDISNSRRLGKSEVELIQDMYDGVSALLKAEDQC